MEQLYEKDDLLNMPIQCFHFDSTQITMPVKVHWHYYMEILYITEGVASITSGHNSYDLTPGNLILLHPKEIHSIDSVGTQPLRMYGLKLDISRINIVSSYSPKMRSIFRCAENQNMRTIFTPQETERMGVQSSLYNCISEIKKHQYGYDLVIRSYISRLLTEIIRLWLQEDFNIDQQAFMEDEYYDLYNITEYIDANLGKNIRVADIAVQCKMSYSYFARKFQDAYGKSCKDYIEEMRLYKVEELLRYTNFDLTYISQETGFSDCSHLIHQFKKMKGMTPKQFRTGLAEK